MSGRFGAANHCNHQPTGDGLPKLFLTIYPAHRCIRARFRRCTVSDTGRKVTSYCLWSRTLTAAERNYYLHSSKIESLALKWAITEQFRDYLYYAPHFIAYTDNNPLTYVLISARLNATGHDWVAELSDFNFTVKYRLTANRDADALSRMPFEQSISECKEEVEPEWIKATVEATNAHRQGETVWLAALSSRPKAESSV